ncbi:MAG: RdgB/HAM1 family non-canonical purine NTP pyrophosphatase [Pyrinomonadaceae bacterium]
MATHKPFQLLIGTRNQGKIQEIRNALKELPLVLRTLDEFPGLNEPIELDRSYEENAVIKARHYSEQTGFCTLADDSGLEVEALGGAPGVLSARYGGKNISDEDRVNLLLAELNQTDNRRARFICVIAIAGLSSTTVAYGASTGRIAEAPRGKNGFGYDPVFIPDGYGKTFAELTTSVKDRISHRGRALAKAREYLKSQATLTSG